MPNQRNYGNPIVTFSNERMFRLVEKDQLLLKKGDKMNIFGGNDRQNVELWFNKLSGEEAGHIRVAASDPNIQLVSLVHADGINYEYLILNLEKIIEAVTTPDNKIGLPVGRYSVAISVYQDEVGSRTSEGNRLILSDISPTRTEIKLKAKDKTQEIHDEIYEFVVPSVPRIFAKALLDQLFAKSAPSTIEQDEFIVVAATPTNPIIRQLDLLSGANNTLDRINNSWATTSFVQTVNEVLSRTYGLALEDLLAERADARVQKEEFMNYIEAALQETLDTMELNFELDPRFDFIS